MAASKCIAAEERPWISLLLSRDVSVWRLCAANQCHILDQMKALNTLNTLVQVSDLSIIASFHMTRQSPQCEEMYPHYQPQWSSDRHSFHANRFSVPKNVEFTTFLFCVSQSLIETRPGVSHPRLISPRSRITQLRFRHPLKLTIHQQGQLGE